MMASQHHAVRIYREAVELAGHVAAHLAAGLEAGEPGLVVARPAHVALFTAALGRDAATLEQRGLLRLEDAEATLDRILEDGRPSAAAFERVVGGILDDLAERFPGRQARVFGEMVDVLSERGETAAAISLEELWNSLAWSRRFSLLCGYRLDVFDLGAQTSHLPEICRTHTHVAPAQDARRFALAVDGALEEVLGGSEAGKVYVLVGAQVREERVPAPQLVLMWLSENMPGAAERVLDAARRRYAAAPAV